MVTTKEERYIHSSSTGINMYGEILITIFEKDKNKKTTSISLSAESEKEKDLKVILIIKLVDYILDRFSK